MKQEILNSYTKLNSLNVSRETYLDFELFISMIIEKNKEINIISQETAKNEVIREWSTSRSNFRRFSFLKM